MQKFVKNLLKFGTRFLLCWPETERKALVDAYDEAYGGKGSLLQAVSADTSGCYLAALTALIDGKPLRNDDPAKPLFRRLVLGWIDADFRVQGRIFQHFSKSYKKIIFSRANFANFCQKIGKFCKNFDIFWQI